MADRINTDLCPNSRMSSLISAIGGDEARGLRDLDELLMDFPKDPRLHFLKGSLLAGKQDFTGARSAMHHAVELAPDYAIARFQLGFLLLTSGEPVAAQEIWGPLHALPGENYLYLFVIGLCHLIRDEFEDAVRVLRDGMARNRENPAMNRDMQLIIDEIHRKLDGTPEGRPVSSVDFLLQQSALKPARR